MLLPVGRARVDWLDVPRRRRHGRRRNRRNRERARGAGALLVFGQELEVARFLLFLQRLGLALDVLAEQRVHEERKIEGGGGEVTGEEQGVDRLAHLLDLGVALLAVGRKRLLQDFGNLLRNRVVVARGALQARLLDARADVGAASLLLEGLPRQRLVQDGTDGIDIGARVARLSAGALFRGEITEVLARQAGLAHAAGPVAEAPEPDLALVGHHDAAGGDQAVIVAATAFGLAAVGILEG
jgi:hypothetical protein